MYEGNSLGKAFFRYVSPRRLPNFFGCVFSLRTQLVLSSPQKIWVAVSQLLGFTESICVEAASFNMFREA
jgi:hypothetical protein